MDLLQSSGYAISLDEIYEHVQQALWLTVEVDLRKDGNSLVIYRHNVRNSLASLKRQGKIESPKRGYWQQTKFVHEQSKKEVHHKPTFVVTRIVDGDTFDVYPRWRIQRGRFLEGVCIRPVGYDTPEQGQTGYCEATKKLEELIFEKEICIENVSFVDRYGRLGAQVLFQGINLYRFFPEFAIPRNNLPIPSYEPQVATKFNTILKEVHARISKTLGVDLKLIDTIVSLSKSQESSDGLHLNKELELVINQSRLQVARVANVPIEDVNFRVDLPTAIDLSIREKNSRLKVLGIRV